MVLSGDTKSPISCRLQQYLHLRMPESDSFTVLIPSIVVQLSLISLLIVIEFSSYNLYTEPYTIMSRNFNNNSNLKSGGFVVCKAVTPVSFVLFLLLHYCYHHHRRRRYYYYYCVAILLLCSDFLSDRNIQGSWDVCNGKMCIRDSGIHI